MRKLDKHQLAILTVVIVVATVFCVGYYSLNSKIESNRFAQAQGKLEEAKRANISAELPLLARRVEQLKLSVGDFDSRVPLNRNFASLWQKITSIMDEYQLCDRLVRPSKEIVGEKICCIPIEIECRGGMEQVFSFFRALEKLERQVKIEKVSLENDSQMSGNIKVKAKANVYYRLSQTI